MTVALAYPEEPDDAVVVTSIRISLAGDLACFARAQRAGIAALPDGGFVGPVAA
jgi:hypothetical protein